jgi:hypothetical protein
VFVKRFATVAHCRDVAASTHAKSGMVSFAGGWKGLTG